MCGREQHLTTNSNTIMLLHYSMTCSAVHSWNAKLNNTIFAFFLSGRYKIAFFKQNVCSWSSDGYVPIYLRIQILVLVQSLCGMVTATTHALVGRAGLGNRVLPDEWVKAVEGQLTHPHEQPLKT